MSNRQFSVILSPWGQGWGEVGINLEYMVGYWERKDGSEGGTLTFDCLPGGVYELIDYDGAGVLPNAVVSALRAAGFVLDETFD